MKYISDIVAIIFISLASGLLSIYANAKVNELICDKLAFFCKKISAGCYDIEHCPMSINIIIVLSFIFYPLLFFPIVNGTVYYKNRSLFKVIIATTIVEAVIFFVNLVTMFLPYVAKI